MTQLRQLSLPASEHVRQVLSQANNNETIQPLSIVRICKGHTQCQCHCHCWTEITFEHMVSIQDNDQVSMCCFLGNELDANLDIGCWHPCRIHYNRFHRCQQQYKKHSSTDSLWWKKKWKVICNKTTILFCL